MKKRIDVCWRLGLLVLVSLAVLSPARSAFAGFAEEVEADEPDFWWRMDDTDEGELAENIGALDIDGGEYSDAELGVHGLIASDPNSTAVRFDGDFSQLRLNDAQDLNLGGPWDEKSVVLWFQAADADPGDPQVIYEQGGTTRGLNVYVHEGQVFVGAWNRAAGDGGGIASPWPTDNAGMEIIAIGAPIEAGQTYQVGMSLVLDPEGFDGTMTAFLNGEAIGQEDGIGHLFAHGDDSAIGYHQSETAFPGVNATGGGGYFEGVIDEVALYNVALSAERIKAQYDAATRGGGLPGDFNNDGELNVIDIELLSAEVRAETNNLDFDVNNDKVVNGQDRSVWVKELKHTWFGDANFDGEFNSSDFVTVFSAGLYEKEGSADWGQGDWNGDGKFDSSDFVSAFSDGGYEQGPVPPAVPEPSSLALLTGGLVIFALRRRSR
ncbi:MAG: PEP-CTERM sorting domain-containing protein [Planctomycetales bacterium]|nr:PEP-CTERM sorting domain-containing protein [Planctomycetales bacterium]